MTCHVGITGVLWPIDDDDSSPALLCATCIAPCCVPLPPLPLCVTTIGLTAGHCPLCATAATALYIWHHAAITTTSHATPHHPPTTFTQPTHLTTCPATLSIHPPAACPICATHPFCEVLPDVPDHSCVSVGTQKDTVLQTVTHLAGCSPQVHMFHWHRVVCGSILDPGNGARGIVEMLFCTSLIALVGAADQPQSSPRKLQIMNTKVHWMIERTLHILTHEPVVPVHDLQAIIPLFHPCCQA